jgi:hypothetical protein
MTTRAVFIFEIFSRRYKAMDYVDHLSHGGVR